MTRGIVLAMFAQASLALLDVAGIALFGLLTYTLSSGGLPSQMIQSTFLENLSQFESASLLLGLAITFFSAKGLLAPLFFNFASTQIATSASRLSIKLTRNFFAQSVRVLDRDTSFENLYTVGVSALGIINLGLGSILILSSELALLTLVVVLLTVVNPLLSLITVLYFFIVLFLLQKNIAKKLIRRNTLLIESNLNSAKVFMDMFNNYRELTASRKFQLYEKEYEQYRTSESQSSMRVLLLNIIPKYVFEIAFFLGAGIIFMFLVTTETSNTAIVQMTIFIAGGSRILPSILRIQGALSGLNTVENNLDRVNDLEKLKKDALPNSRVLIETSRDLRQPVVQIEDLKFRYSPEGDWNINIPHLQIVKGERVAIVGASGAGKSTLVDLILGVQEFQFGNLKVFLNSPNSTIYIPQKLSLLTRSIAENVALGVPKSEISEKSVRGCLEKVGLSDLVASLPEGIHTQVGERGVFLSGGQMQRIALSRVFYSSPELLILDEATSSLDSASEKAITNTISELPKELTTIIVAHRLSTIKEADRVIYIKSGEIRGQGTFEEVRNQVNDFDQQARLMGL